MSPFNIVWKKPKPGGTSEGQPDFYWVQVGRAFPTKSGTGFNLVLDALPLAPDWDGQLVMVPAEPKKGAA